MGRKIFVSYKYWDTDVKALAKYSSIIPKVRDYVDWLEDKLTNRTDHIYKGEHNNEDLSIMSENYIWSKLRNKIYDSSLTIVLISPNFKEPHKWDRSQWIPWEISYSLRKTTRSNFTSQRNAILAVVLPDAKGSYSYYRSMRLFGILQANIHNGYIPVVEWDSFKYNCDYYINKAYDAQKNTAEWKLQIAI